MMNNTFLTACSIALLLYSCKDEDVISNPELTSTQATKDHLFAEQSFNDVARIVEEGFLMPGIKGSFPSYNLINNSTLIINFGTNCIYNQRLYSGKIITTYTGNYRDSLSVMTTTFDNYHVNNNLIQGERIVTNEGRNSNGNMWFTIAVNNASITPPQNGTINWESNSTREWINGQNTYYNFLDDILVMLPLILCIYYKIDFSEFLFMLTMIYLLREITTSVTLLPPTPYCINKSKERNNSSE